MMARRSEKRAGMAQRRIDPLVVTTDSPEATEAEGESLGALLRPGDLVLLSGPYGAGKTCFTRGVARGAEVPDPRAVTSPTFVLMNVYGGRVRVHHLDCHRLSPAEIVDLGLGDVLREGAVVVEWGERVPPDLAESVLTIDFALTAPTRRRLEFGARGERAAELVEALRGKRPVRGAVRAGAAKGKGRRKGSRAVRKAPRTRRVRRAKKSPRRATRRRKAVRR
jgi:tRNA threonylcarbamoyladenosine biosynthesis protein TsaE